MGIRLNLRFEDNGIGIPEVVTYSKEIIGFVLILVVVVVLMCLIPQLVVYLPNLVFGE